MALEFIDELEEQVKKAFAAIRAKFQKVETDGTPLTAEHDKQAKREAAAALANVTAKIGNPSVVSDPKAATAPTVDGTQPTTVEAPESAEPDNDLGS
jgi:hypothetical protein